MKPRAYDCSSRSLVSFHTRLLWRWETSVKSLKQQMVVWSQSLLLDEPSGELGQDNEPGRSAETFSYFEKVLLCCSWVTQTDSDLQLLFVGPDSSNKIFCWWRMSFKLQWHTKILHLCICVTKGERLGSLFIAVVYLSCHTNRFK